MVAEHELKLKIYEWFEIKRMSTSLSMWLKYPAMKRQHWLHLSCQKASKKYELFFINAREDQ